MNLPPRDSRGRFVKISPYRSVYYQDDFLIEIFSWSVLALLGLLTFLAFQLYLNERSSAAATGERSTAVSAPRSHSVAMTPVMVDGALPVKSAEAGPHLVRKSDSASLAETHPTACENHASFTTSLKRSNEAAADGLAENKQGVTTSHDAPACLLGKGPVTAHPTPLSSSVDGHAEEYNTPSKTESRIAGVLPSHKDSRYSRYQARPAQFNFSPGGDVFEQLEDAGN